MKMYKTNDWRLQIESAEVDRANDKSVWINGRRSARESSYERYFETWDEAHNFLLKRAENKIMSYERQLSYAKEELQKTQALKNPEL